MVTLNSMPLDNPKAVSDTTVATERLIQKVSDGHAGSIDFAKDPVAAGGTASSAAAAGSSATDLPEPGIFEDMMQMEELRTRAKQLNEVSLATQKEREAVEQQLTQMQCGVEPKRAHAQTHATGSSAAWHIGQRARWAWR